MDRKSEPDNQFDAYLRHPDCRDVLCDVHVWMPRGNHSDMQIEIFAQYVYSCEKEKYQKIRNPLDGNKSPVSEIPNNELIPLDFFESFIGAALECWSGFSEKIRQAIVALHPLTEPSVVRDYLASFSAFEGVVSCMGDAELITGRDWKQIEAFLCKCVGESEMSSAHKELIKKKLPELKRESLASKANRFFEVKKIYVTDLLPVFEGRASLLKIRNRLAHGDGFHNDSEVLIAAGEHLKVLLERVAIRCLGGDIAQTNDGVTQIRQGYYFSPDRVNELKVKLEVMVNSD